MPGVTVAAGSQDVGGTGGDNQISFAAYGGNFRDSRIQVNGLMVGDPQVGGGRSMYVPHAGSSAGSRRSRPRAASARPRLPA